MGEANRAKQNSVIITHDELRHAIKNWSRVYWSLSRGRAFPHISPVLSNFLGRDMMPALQNSNLLAVPPHIARKIRLLASPHCEVLIRVYYAKKLPKK